MNALTAFDELEAAFQESYDAAHRIAEIRHELTTVMDEGRREALTSELAELTADCSVDETEMQLHEAGLGSAGIM